MEYCLPSLNINVMKLHKMPDCIDYHDLIKVIEDKHGIDVDDYAGHFSEETRENNKKIKLKWLEENGYGGKEHVLDVPDPSKPNIDWPANSEELNLRIEINTKYRLVKKELESRPPYLNYWHTICDDVSRGGVTALWIEPSEDDGKEDDHSDYDYKNKEKPLPEKYRRWRQEINALIYEEVKDSPAYDEEGFVNVYIDW
jgi:hypothetical protein